MNRRTLRIILPLLALAAVVALAATPALSDGAGGIIVTDADAIREESPAGNGGLFAAAEDILPRAVVECANAIRHVDLEAAPTPLSAALSRVVDRVVLQYANAIRHVDLEPAPGPLGSALGQIVDRVVLQYANAVRHVDLEPAPGALGSALAGIADRVVVQYANGIRHEPLVYPGTPPAPTPTPGPSHSVSGRVTDKDGNGVAGVLVSTDNSSSATTNSDGYYQIEGMAAGQRTVSPQHGDHFAQPSSIVLSLSGDRSNVDFRVYSCQGPSELNVCGLRPGDIVLTAGPNWICGGLHRPFFRAGGTYFTHALLYIGETYETVTSTKGLMMHRIVEAAGPALAGYSDEDQVREADLIDVQAFFDNTECLMDWAVVRPIASDWVKSEAVDNARTWAAHPDVRYSIVATRASNTRFYCSKLAWRAYLDVPGGPDLEEDRRVVPGIGGEAIDAFYVTPDDLYYGSPTVDTKPIPIGQAAGRWVFTLWSPAHLTLVDPLGRRAGYNPETGGVFDEIPNCYYVAPPDAEVETIAALGADETWQLIVTGYDDGEYTLVSEFLDARTRLDVVQDLTYDGRTQTYDVPVPVYELSLPIIRR